MLFKKGGVYGDYYVVGQDHLGGTSSTLYFGTDPLSTVAYEPFGATRSSTGTTPTDKLFTGQRLDGTGLYYYNARYYDATIGRFISPDPVMSSTANLQSLNSYSYAFNNPLGYVDPSGLTGVYWDSGGGFMVWVDASMLGVEGFAEDNPDLAIALINQMEADNYDNPSAMSPGTSVDVWHDDPLHIFSNLGDVTIVHAANDTYILVYNPPAQGQTTGTVRATVLWKDSSKREAQAQDVSIQVGSVPTGQAAFTWTPNWTIRWGESFDKMTVDMLAHETTHVRQAVSSGLGNLWSLVYLYNRITEPVSRRSWWESQEAGAYATHRVWYLTARVPYIVGVVP